MPKGMLPKETLQKLLDEPNTAVLKVPKTMHLAIHPQYLGNIQLGIANYLNNGVNRYNTDLDGIFMGYNKIRLKEPKAEVLNEEHYLHLDIHSEFWIFRPQVNTILSGVVNKKSPAHVSILVHGLFNVPCYKNLDSGDVWIGSKLSVGDHIKVRILQMDLNQRVPFLLGELFESEGEMTADSSYKNEPLDIMLIENIKEEKTWSDLTGVDEENNVDGEEEPQKKKKKKKKKKSRKDSEEGDEENIGLASPLVLSNSSASLHRSKREDSPILSQIETSLEQIDANGEADNSLLTKKKKKKKKANRSLSPIECPKDSKPDDTIEESDNDGTPAQKELAAAILSTLNKKSTVSFSPAIANDEKIKEDLSKSLILDMLSREKKSKKKKKDNTTICNNSISSVIAPEGDDEAEAKRVLSESLIQSLLIKEKKLKRKSIASALPENVSDSVEATKRKRSLSESSKLMSSEKKRKVEASLETSVTNEDLHSSSISSPQPPGSTFSSPQGNQDPRLPPGWTVHTYGTSNRKYWANPSGKRFQSFKSAQESSCKIIS